MTYSEFHAKTTAYLADPSVPFIVKDTVKRLLQMDPVDALKYAADMAAIAEGHLNVIEGQSLTS